MRSILLTSLLIGPISFAADIDDAYAAYTAGQYEKAFTQYKTLAERGDALAQFNYAMMLKQGEGHENSTDWQSWLEKAAKAGLVSAAYAMGLAYEYGNGMEKSQSLASHWFQVAAEKGHTQAQVSLATQYFLGRGVSKDFQRSAYWYEKAAEGGDVAAQYLIASMLEHGDGVAIDLINALKWYSAAARQGDQVAKFKANELAKRANP
ncbi:tetratricopeptide repeat protein [Chitinimonas sp. PSY-7]|uniref:tetratricopeptide repeat protein n=1 Tax=Chitinimonas sp. PSY-7 TaxID=3459088 RepID=UPI004040280D